MRVAVSRKWRVPTFILDKLAPIITVPQSLKNRFLRIVVVIAYERLEMFGRLRAVV